MGAIIMNFGNGSFYGGLPTVTVSLNSASQNTVTFLQRTVL